MKTSPSQGHRGEARGRGHRVPAAFHEHIRLSRLGKARVCREMERGPGLGRVLAHVSDK